MYKFVAFFRFCADFWVLTANFVTFVWFWLIIRSSSDNNCFGDCEDDWGEEWGWGVELKVSWWCYNCFEFVNIE